MEGREGMGEKKPEEERPYKRSSVEDCGKARGVKGRRREKCSSWG